VTDIETICNFMEPWADSDHIEGLKWHTAIYQGRCAEPLWKIKPLGPLTLDALWEVEESLREAGIRHSSCSKDHPFMTYTCELLRTCGLRQWEHCKKTWGYHGNPHDFFPAIHATAAQRIKALAEAIRSMEAGK
jgi:hypothetical protein